MKRIGILRTRADIAKNRLYLDFCGVVTRKKMEALYTDIRFAVADLLPGFDLISDYSECNLLQLDSLPSLKRIMGFLLESGLREIVRIITKDNVSYKQVLNLNVRIQGYKPVYASSRDEVEEKLSALTKRNGVRILLHDVQVEYETISQNGSGRIVDISTSGCAMEMHSGAKGIELKDEIVLQIAFGHRTAKPAIFKVKSRAVRIDGNLLAVEFAEIKDEAREQLWKYLLVESRN